MNDYNDNMFFSQLATVRNKNRGLLEEAVWRPKEVNVPDLWAHQRTKVLVCVHMCVWHMQQTQPHFFCWLMQAQVVSHGKDRGGVWGAVVILRSAFGKQAAWRRWVSLSFVCLFRDVGAWKQVAHSSKRPRPLFSKCLEIITTYPCCLVPLLHFTWCVYMKVVLHHRIPAQRSHLFEAHLNAVHSVVLCVQ